MLITIAEGITIEVTPHSSVLASTEQGATQIQLPVGTGTGFLAFYGSRLLIRGVDYTLADGVMTLSVPIHWTRQLVLVDLATGDTLWVFDPRGGQVYPQV